ncbi:hypothetical protein ACFL4C_01075 [Candidatus Omnitrophota bacterium]
MLNCDIKNFKKVITASSRLLQGIDPHIFLSPYSLVPVISQMLGLNTPLMGSGDSCYSIISIIFNLRAKNRLLKEIFMLSLDEKRRVIDEIYEMIAPLLLEEEEGYIDLLVNTKFKRQLKYNKKIIAEFRKILKEKFSLLSLLIQRFPTQDADFGYIVHYGYPQDLYREFAFLEALPKPLAQEWRRHSYPIVNEVILKDFPNDCFKTKSEIKGWILFITNHTRELLEDGQLRKNKILKAAKLAQKLGAKIIGMGGLIASFAQGGGWLSQELPDIGFTTGHAYTIGNILGIIELCTKRVGLDIKKATIAIIGAAGSIGSGCAKLLSAKKPGEIILIDLSTFSAAQKIEYLIKQMQEINPYIKVSFSHSFNILKKADIIIAATNSPTSIISTKHLKKGAIIIDDSFPKNVSQEVFGKRKDIILLEGGMMQLPLNIDVISARNMPDLMDVPLTRVISCKETYGCVAEIMVLALYGYRKNYGLGYADPLLAKDIMTKAKRVGFRHAPLQCYDKTVENKRFINVAKIIKVKK